MDKDVKVGDFGDVDFSFVGGVASVSGKASAMSGGLALDVKLSCDVKLPLEALRKAVDGKLPSEAPAIDMVFGWLEAALAGVK